MNNSADRKWKWVVGAVMLTLIASGCAGMNAAGGKEASQSQGQPGAVEELPPSSVDVQEQEAPPAGPETMENFMHTVRFEGETLSLIAKWYTGRLSNWKELAEVNPEINPDRIFMGNEILIPEELLITRDPMPQSFIDKSYSKKKPVQ